MIGVLVVAFRPRLEELSATLAAVAQARRDGVPIVVHVWHNDEGPQFTAGLTALVERTRADGLVITVDGSGANLGYGGGVNALLARVDEPYLLVLNQDAMPEPGALVRLWDTVRSDAGDVAAWELRQIPYEHPKDYDPVTLDTGWFSGAAVLLRAAALRQQGGFEPRIHMYGEDVDLSWRLRCAGWRLRYLPRSAVVHHAYRYAGEVKPLQALGSTYANLCIRTRFAARTEVLRGLRQAVHGLRGPEPFAGWRRGLLRVLARFALNYPYFRRTRRSGPGFEPCLRGWDYEVRRDGAFHASRSAAEQPAPKPLVTVIATATGSPALWRMLACLDGQTHRPLEVVVVAMGDDDFESACVAFGARLEPWRLSRREGEGIDSAVARAVAACRGEWITVVDADTQVLYADHLEALVQGAHDRSAAGARGLAWRLHDQAGYRSLGHLAALERVPTAGVAVASKAPLVRRDAALRGEGGDVAQVEKLTSIEFDAGPAVTPVPL